MDNFSVWQVPLDIPPEPQEDIDAEEKIIEETGGEPTI